MVRFTLGRLALVSLLIVPGCRHHSRTPALSGKPTWSFGVLRGTTESSADDGHAPIQLTASDGTGLKLVALDARVAIEGPLAFTELTMAFENPLDRTLEGHFDIVLPNGAAVSRFAMQLSNGWQEAEVVEKQAARVAYEDALHRRQDPALLEKAAGNEFSARVFPIAPRAVKHIKLSYSQELPSTDEPYRLRLRGLPLVPDLAIEVFVAETVVRIAKQQFLPDADFLLERPGAASGLQSGKLVVARLRPPLPGAKSKMAGVVLLFDSSASRAPGFSTQAKDLGALIEELRKVHGDALPLRVAAFDQEVAPLYAGTAGGFSHDAKTILENLTTRGALGASDIAGALAWAARSGEANHQRVVLISDGVATASASVVAEKIDEAGDDSIAMARAVDALKPRFDRFDIILVGGIHDEVAMRPLVTHHLAEDGALLDGGEGAERLVKRLDAATWSGVRVSVEGAAWSWPSTVDGIQRGDDLMVFAELNSDRLRDEATVKLAGPVTLSSDVPLASPETAGLHPLVERAWARARIASLTVEAAALPPSAHEAAKVMWKQILDLSTRYRVLSDRTSLLVLESDADYARFHIDRHALADILVVGDDGLRLEQRRDAVVSDEAYKARLRDLEKKVDELKNEVGRSKTRLALLDDTVLAGEAEEKAKGEERPSPDSDRRARASNRPGQMGALKLLTDMDGDGVNDGDPLSASTSNAAAPPASPVMAPPPVLEPTREGYASTGHARTAAVHRALDAMAGDGMNLDGIFAGAPGIGRAGAGGQLAQLLNPGASAQVANGELSLVTGALDVSSIRRIVQSHAAQVRVIYQRLLTQNPRLMGRVVLRIAVDASGRVTEAVVENDTLGNARFEQDLIAAARTWRFPAGQSYSFRFPLLFSAANNGASPPADTGAPPYTGKMLEVMNFVADKKLPAALARALAWRSEEPGDVLALVALGNVWKESGKLADAARAYGSIIDLFPARADLRRFAGDLLESLGPEGEPLAADSFAHAARDRADHPNSHRLRAFSLLRAGHFAEAFAAIELGASRTYPAGRFAEVDRILREDAGLIAAAWLAHDPSQRAAVEKRLAMLHAALPTTSSLRFVLSWETDANDVDFHISDATGNRAWYAQKHLASGGDLYADVTTGYGPECFTIEGKPTAYPYRIQAHYYSRGPMGYGMGKVEIIEHDGHGGLRFDERPFVVMNDQAFVDLGTIAAPLPPK